MFRNSWWRWLVPANEWEQPTHNRAGFWTGFRQSFVFLSSLGEILAEDVRCSPEIVSLRRLVFVTGISHPAIGIISLRFLTREGELRRNSKLDIIRRSEKLTYALPDSVVDSSETLRIEGKNLSKYSIQKFKYPITHSLTHSLTHSPTHPLTHSLIHPPTHSPTHSLSHSPTHLFTQTPTCDHSFIHLTHFQPEEQVDTDFQLLSFTPVC